MRDLFTDQKWVNLAPCMFDEVKVLRSPAFNVATWNLSTRKATGSLKEGIQINGEDLGFYHFSGFDSGLQETALKEYGNHSPVLCDLREWYIRSCEQHGQDQLGAIPCKYSSYDNGETILDQHRILYRARLDLQQTFPNPYATSGLGKPELTGGYQAWYQAQEELNVSDSVLSVAPDTTMKSFLANVANYLDARIYSTAGINPIKKLTLKFTASCLRGAAKLAS